ncbi:MAG TPA: diphthamide synthesis protein [Candidatus Nanoarchaeia archaeon]|nr:diphthamide synthesis protein [Candidatus Nanoarchaeia archaeon]
MKSTNILFIEARKKSSAFEQELNSFIGHAEKILSALPPSFLIAYTIQYKFIAEKLKDFFKAKRKNVSGFMQVLGCTALRAKEKNILLVGSGKFHALQLALQGKNMYIYENGKISRISKPDTDRLVLKKKIALSKFLSSEAIGIIVSSKPGQNNISLAISLKKKINNMGKTAFIFLEDNVSPNELENFSTGFWVNTACPGIAVYNDSNNIVNYTDIWSVLP